MTLADKGAASRYLLWHIMFFVASGAMFIAFPAGAPTAVLLPLGVLVAMTALAINLGTPRRRTGTEENGPSYTYRHEERRWVEASRTLGLSERRALILWRALLALFFLSGLASFIIWLVVS